MPHLVGEGPVQVGFGLHIAHQTDGVVQDNDAVAGVKCGAEKGKPLCPPRAVVAIDFRNHKHVDVVGPAPAGQALHGNLIGTVHPSTRRNSVFFEARNTAAIHADDAVGGFVMWGSLGQFKLDERVHARPVAVAPGNLSEILVEPVDGGEDLGIADVLFHTHCRPTMHDVHHHRQGVHDEGTWVAGLLAFLVSAHSGHRCPVLRKRPHDPNVLLLSHARGLRHTLRPDPNQEAKQQKGGEQKTGVQEGQGREFDPKFACESSDFTSARRCFPRGPVDL